MRFSETVKLAREDLVISRRHDAWVVGNDAHPIYSDLALRFAYEQLTRGDRERQGTVSASSLGECVRYQQFVYLGMRKLPPDAKNAAKMQNGSFMHLRWQMEGLSEGWLAQVEVPVAGYQLHGTMDGISFDDRVVELKSINMNGFSRVQSFGPLLPHLFQMATYMLCTGKRGIFLYECKDNQEYKEIPVERDQVPLAEAEQRARAVWNLIETKHLEEPLSKCLDREGWVYNSCPFRDRCLKILAWEGVA